MKYFLIFFMLFISAVSYADVKIIEIGDLTEAQMEAVVVFSNYKRDIKEGIVIAIGTITLESSFLEEDISCIVKTVKKLKATVLILEMKGALEFEMVLTEDSEYGDMFKSIYRVVASREKDYSFSPGNSITNVFLSNLMHGKDIVRSFVDGNNVVSSLPCLFYPVFPIIRKDRQLSTTWGDIKNG